MQLLNEIKVDSIATITGVTISDGCSTLPRSFPLGLNSTLKVIFLKKN